MKIDHFDYIVAKEEQLRPFYERGKPYRDYDWKYLLCRPNVDDIDETLPVTYLFHDYEGIEFDHISPWILYDEYSAFRHIATSNPNEITGRVAFIEKTARVRTHFVENAWAYGYSDSEDYGKARRSLAWCDWGLIQLGYTFPNTKKNMEMLAKLNEEFKNETLH